MKKILFYTIIIMFSFSCKKTEQPGPIAKFTADKYYVLINDTVKFNDSSSNFPSNYLWHFDGGSPEYSTEKNPFVLYNKIGSFSVSLKVSSDKGIDSINKDNIINVDYFRVGVVNAGVKYKNLTQDSTIRVSFTLDINNDGINDLKLSVPCGTICGGSSSIHSAFIETLNRDVLILVDSVSPKVLTHSDTFENQSGWNSGRFVLFSSAYIGCSNPPIDVNTGNWFSIDHRYIGIKVKNKIGWIQIGTTGSKSGWFITNYCNDNLTVYDYGIKN